MKKHLLPFLFIALLFSGCQEPDDDVDMPVPEKTLDEKISGDWDLINSSDVYFFHKNKLAIQWGGEYHDAASGDYFITEVEDKDYLTMRIDHSVLGPFTTYEITSISDSSMTWETPKNTDTEYHEKLDFRRRKVIGQWRTTSITKVTYDNAGNILKKENNGNKTFYYNLDYNYFTFEATKEEALYSNQTYYSINYTKDGKTHLSIERNNVHEAFEVEALFPNDNQMTWIQKESPTVSYVTEFTKEER